MPQWRLLILSFTFCCSAALSAQSPEEDYVQAHKAFRTHVREGGFLHDNSLEAIASLHEMWTEAASFLAIQRQQNPSISAQELDHALCLLTAEPPSSYELLETPEQQCQQRRQGEESVLELEPHLLLVAPSAGATGTVFLMTEHDGSADVLWSIADASPQPLDPHGLIGAWQLARSAGACRKEGSSPQTGSCGPLMASVGSLPHDSDQKLRFYVDAIYPQFIGSTFGKQTSIWTWDGHKAELQWVNWYDFMADQAAATTLDARNNMLIIGQKGEFRTFADCGSCIERPLEQRVLLTQEGVTDLGVHSLAPEMDAIDELVWQLSHGQPTAQIASPQAANFLRKPVLKATRASRKIDPKFYSVGMVSAVTLPSTTGAVVCMNTEDLDSIAVQLRRTAEGGFFVEQVNALNGHRDLCPNVGF